MNLFGYYDNGFDLIRLKKSTRPAWFHSYIFNTNSAYVLHALTELETCSDSAAAILWFFFQNYSFLPWEPLDPNLF